MSRETDVYLIGATRLVIGLSAILTVTPVATEIKGILKIFSGGGTLELVDGPSTGWGAGYPLAATEIYSLGGPATFFLAATGATMTAALSIGKSQGATTS